MKTFFVTIALGALAIPAAALAQTAPPAAVATPVPGAAIAGPMGVGGRHGGWMQRDLTRQQAQQRAQMMFQRLDLNHDGTVTRQEAEQAAAQFAARREQAEAAHGDRATRMVDRMFGNAQAITLVQAQAQAMARFDAEDLNHDGVVTAAEREQSRAAKRAARNPG